MGGTSCSLTTASSDESRELGRVLGAALGAGSLVALTGVVINDALVLVDRANRNRREGLAALASLEEAAATRFRAIVLTSLTTFFGLLPLLFEKSAQAAWLKPMAVALGFGVVAATVITLVLLPAAYAALDSGLARARATLPSGNRVTRA